MSDDAITPETDGDATVASVTSPTPTVEGDPTSSSASVPAPPVDTTRRVPRWLIAVAAAAILVLGLGAVAAAAFEFDGHGGGHGRKGEDRAEHNVRPHGGRPHGGRPHDRNDDDGAWAPTSSDATSPGSPAVTPATGSNPNGPVVIEPTTPGGERTVVWPDGRIVTIPAPGPSSPSTVAPTTSTP